MEEQRQPYWKRFVFVKTGISFADAVDKIAKKFSMSHEKAEGEVKEYWQD